MNIFRQAVLTDFENLGGLWEVIDKQHDLALSNIFCVPGDHNRKAAMSGLS